jgi:osmotically-inducible protein OsmY
MSDISLRQDILDELEFEPAINAAHIGVAVDQNVATLTGNVASYAEKTAALAAVRRVRGVRAVADEIQVHYPFEKKTSDSEVAKRALDILEWDTMIPSGSVNVVVRDGWLTLGGEVDWYYQKKRRRMMFADCQACAASVIASLSSLMLKLLT